MNTTATAVEWLHFILLGGVMGVLGQGIRATAGLKKINEQADLENLAFSNVFELPIFLTSIALGFTAGAVTAIATSAPGTPLDAKFLMTLAVAGYTGSDFIESFVRGHIPARFRSKQTSGQRVSEENLAGKFQNAAFTSVEAPATVSSIVVGAIADTANVSSDTVKMSEKLSGDHLQLNAAACIGLSQKINRSLDAEGWFLAGGWLHARDVKPAHTVQAVINLVKSRKPQRAG